MEQPTTQLEGFAIVEIMGHTKLAGRVKTEPFGSVIMLRVDVPELPEKRRQEQRSWDDDTGRYYPTPVIADVVQPAEPAFTRYFGMQAVFSLTPCDEATAMAMLDRMRKQPPKLLRVTSTAAGELPDHTATGVVAEVSICGADEIPFD